MPLQRKDKERAPYFLRPSVHRFLALRVAVVVGRFVPLAFTAFVLGINSTHEKRKKRRLTRKKKRY